MGIGGERGGKTTWNQLIPKFNGAGKAPLWALGKTGLWRQKSLFSVDFTSCPAHGLGAPNPRIYPKEPKRFWGGKHFSLGTRDGNSDFFLFLSKPRFQYLG